MFVLLRVSVYLSEGKCECVFKIVSTSVCVSVYISTCIYVRWRLCIFVLISQLSAICKLSASLYLQLPNFRQRNLLPIFQRGSRLQLFTLITAINCLQCPYDVPINRESFNKTMQPTLTYTIKVKLNV